MKKRFIVLFTCCFVSLQAQVGVNTDDPQTMLDVDGSVNLRNELRVGGTEQKTGNPGKVDQILVSQGEGKSPVWKDATVKFFQEDEYRVTSTFLETDETGIHFGNTTGDGILMSVLGEDIKSTSPKWTEIPGLTSTVKVENSKNRLNVSFQTGVEMSNVGFRDGEYVRFICGIFVNDLLKALRADQINGIYNKGQRNQSIYTLNYTVEDLPEGEHSVKVACRRTDSSRSGYDFSIGRSINETSNAIANNFMLRSVLRYDLNEKVTLVK